MEEDIDLEEEEMEEEEKTDKQLLNNTNKAKSKAPQLMPFMWKKGQSGNPAGRPKGKTMKEYAKELLACQTEEERQEFLHGLSKDIIWKMAEGNPDNKTDITSGGEKIVMTEKLKEIANKYEEELLKTF